MIDDKIIKEKIIDYRDNSNTIDDIKKYLSGYIYNYPRKIFCIDHDKAIDFYIYYLQRFDKILSSYEITEVKFITWFTYTLRSSYLNYIKKTNTDKKYQVSEISLDQTFTKNGSEYSLYEMVESIGYNTSKDEYIKEINKDIEKKYKDSESLIFRLHYLEIFSFFIIHPLMKYFNFTYKQVLDLFEQARLTYLNKYQESMQIEDRITLLTSKIIVLEKNNAKQEDIKKLKERKQKYLERLKKFRIVVSYSFLAKKFFATENKVAKIILKIKKYVKLILLKNNFIL